MTRTLDPRDLPLWHDARSFLDVRSNDVHTLVAYGLARALCAEHPQADPAVVLPAILLHDVGWKTVDPALLSKAVGPNATHPELVRVHEVEGVKIARDILERHRPAGIDTAQVLAIIDTHDTVKTATSLNDAMVKDADKCWRFTPHGVATIAAWFAEGQAETLDMLEDFVMPSMLTDAGRAMARGFIVAARAQMEAGDYLKGTHNV
ncbi:HD domain-containing protein [Yoonia sp.]|uniref:HD domain-containing protein n=1 Tax=Yoonia sp. TaxID=2212373 RepID=UPI001A054B06|nr:HD domain-containing protein [Yoonia sp.]MBE0413715.1 HD domain-containing protein [Yoonia sp.]